MPTDPFFSRSNAESGSEDTTEGVRIIGADEAAEAAERDDVARRQPSDKPRYGDRPPPPDEGARPALRFPLPGGASPSANRPRAAASPPPQRFSFDPPDRPQDPADEPEEEPLISFGPSTGESDLPHWTAPATGEVPRVVIGETDEDPEEAARWAAYGSSGPRWRDENDRWEMDDVADLADEEEPIATQGQGQARGLTHEEFLNFDDLDVPVNPGPQRAPRSRAGEQRQSDPIQLDDAALPPPPPAARPGAQQRQRATGGGRPRGRYMREPSEGGPPSSRDVPQAAFVGVVIAVVAAVLFWLGPAPTMAIVVVALVVAAAELFEGFRRGGFRPATLLGLVAVAALPLSVYWRGEAAIPLVLMLTVVFSMLWYLLGIGGSARAVPNIGATVLGVLYVGLLGAFAALILDVPAEGVSILLVAVVGAVASDVVGFFVGRSIGRTSLSATSPNKTVEGLVGGLLGSLFATFVVAVVFGVGPFSLGSWFVFGLCIAVAAPIGDLAESLLKRDLGLKDMGTVLPGHGGVLDRIDGLLFVLPVAYYVVRLLDLVPL